MRYRFPFLLCAVLCVVSCATSPDRMRLPPDEPAPAKTDTPLPTREVPDTEQVETPEPPRMFESGLLLSFDDDYYAAWEAAFPLFDCYGARVTFFVQGNPAFCLLAEKRGHSIGYHTAAHSDLRRLDFDAWCDETTGSARLLLEKGVRLSAFAYPFGFFEEWMHEELRKTYPVLRGFGVRDLVYRRDGEELKRGFIGSKSIDNTVLQNDDDFFKTIDALFERAAVERGSLVPLTTHTIDDRAQWGIRPDRLEYILKRAGELGLRFYTYGDLHPAPES